MRVVVRFLFLSIWLGLAPRTTLSQTVSKPSVPVRLSVHKPKSFPGEVLRADLTVAKAVESLSLSFGSQKIVFQPQAKTDLWRALVGIDLETKPGRYFLTGSVTFHDGQTVEVEESIQVLPKAFPIQRIAVDDKYVTLDPQAEKRAEEESKKLQAIWKVASPQKFWRGRFLSPVASQLTSGFGRRRIVNNQPRSPHSGVDLKASTGTPIRAANAGKVVLAEDLFFSGNTVVLDHGIGLYTYYAHCSTITAKSGDMVERGQVIAKVGATGRVTGPHLHWACRLNEARVNPLDLTRLWMEQ
ncbi:MAG: M23 family metallopeptidase [Acidobacteria bacterium]|nr:M23 family metallopeptidase [Acidobacteriota bacterium]